MAFRPSDLQEAFFVPVRVPGVGIRRATEPFGDVLAPTYFNAAGELRPGELIYVSTMPRQVHAGGPEHGEVRLALVMVRRDGRGTASVRAVQDFGRPTIPPAR